MQAIPNDYDEFLLKPNTDERGALHHLAEQLNIKPETIIEWIVSYELLKYYQEIQY